MIPEEVWRACIWFWLAPTILAAAVAALIVTLTIFLYHYLQLTGGSYRNGLTMEDKSVIVTGCTSGIGKETVLELANKGARVILACRNLEKAEAVKEEISKATNNTNLIVKKLDLSSFASIREFANDINNTEPKIDVLIHNAGYAETFKMNVTGDGLEMTMQTNHYGPFLLTHLLMPLLKKSAPSRIVIVASSLYRLASFNLDNPNPVGTMPGYLYYASKEANILFTRELARRLRGTGVTANCLHPGLINTGIWRSVPAPLSWMLAVVGKFFFKTPKEGCQTTVMLAVDETLERVSGKYFSDCKEASLSSAVSDMAKAKKLWEISEKMVKLEENDPRIDVDEIGTLKN